MDCKTCIYWKRPYAKMSKFGECEEINHDSLYISVKTNNRDGEWVETTVETRDSFFCKLYKGGNDGSSINDKRGN